MHFRGEIYGFGVCIDQGKLPGIIEQGLLLVLAENVQKQGRQFAQGGNGAGLIVDVDAIALVRRDLSPDNDRGSFRVQSEAVEAGLDIGFENGFNHGARFTGADHFRRSLRSGQKSERVNDDGLSGACFAGEEIKTFFEVKLELIDQSKISNAKKAQHILGRYKPSRV